MLIYTVYDLNLTGLCHQIYSHHMLLLLGLNPNYFDPKLGMQINSSACATKAMCSDELAMFR
jgi:hypothetical protein